MTAYNLYVLVVNLFRVYEALIVVWCVMSWIPRSIGWLQSLREAIGMIVEPYLGLFRRFIPPLGGMDFSPIVAIFALSLIERVVLALIM